MRRRTKPLFNSKRFSEVSKTRLDEAKNDVRHADADRIAGVQKDEFVDHLVAVHGIEPLEVGTDDAHINKGSLSADEDKELIIPIAGNTDILEWRPRTQTVGNSVQGSWTSDELRVELQRRRQRGGWNPERLQNEIDRATGYIDTYMNRLNGEIESFHEDLRDQLEREFDKRREEIQEQRELLGSLDVPVYQQDDTPDTFVIDAPEQREKISVEPPKSDATVSDPAPTVPETAYDDILRVINDVGRGFSRSPHLFQNSEEEDLRDHILFNLEVNFDAGSATGETFNRGGRSDILLRHGDGTNLFVAECAIWQGEQYFIDKINQLNGYLTWRDTKAAVIMFVKNKRMTPVREQIEHGAKNHDQFVELVNQPGESWWQYKFHMKGDSDRELDLAVLAFHIPPE